MAAGAEVPLCRGREGEEGEMINNITIRRAQMTLEYGEPMVRCLLSDGREAVFTAKPAVARMNLASVVTPEDEALFPAIERTDPETGQVLSFGPGLATDDEMAVRLARHAGMLWRRGAAVDGEVLFDASES